jgi:hypothetical protein
MKLDGEKGALCCRGHGMKDKKEASDLMSATGEGMRVSATNPYGC